MAEQLISGSRVWVWVKTGTTHQWTEATVLGEGAQGKAIQVKLANGNAVDVPVEGLFLHNQGQSVEDMTTLTHLHEPGVLHNLNIRYGTDAIYTYTGGILIAVNPFKRIESLVAPGVMDLYQKQGMSSNSNSGQRQLAPHVFSTAVNAYKQMLRDGAGQAILITGESGAGKTETCKLIMRCLAHLGSLRNGMANGNGNGHQHGSSTVEQMVLESNPLLEAFGNAKTSRNDNSSRFGKYVEIQFNSDGVLQGAAIRTYLLERSRVVHVAQGERSFHAFYQLCAGASPEQRKAWHVGRASDYSVLNQSDCKQLPGVDDAHEFQATCQAMECVGLTHEQQQNTFSTVAAILHLGNISFGAHMACPAPADVDLSSVSQVSDAPTPANGVSWQALQWAAELLKVEAGPLLSAMSTRTRQTPDGPITSPLTLAGADEARNALCKELYSRMFTWIVACVNTSLQQNRASSPIANGHNGSFTTNGITSPIASPDAKPLGHAARSPSAGDIANGHGGSAGSVTGAPGQGYSIGLLDIYGFESFEVNDLEQMCINLANEKLQQHFNQHVFKWEQAEYTREGVDWRYIEFVDNQEVLDLVEGKMGLLDLLDEQCRFPTATAEDLAHKYTSTPSISSSKRFEKLRRPPTGFIIQHYAGPVRYHTDNFLEKNKDFVVAEHASLMASSGSDFVSGLFTEPLPGSGAANGLTPPRQNTQSRSGGAPRPPSQGGTPMNGPMSATKSAFKFDSVASQFKRQLAELMATLHVMQPHYVRCIKPNPQNKAGVFDPPYVLQQLKCGGVMEAVRISCTGFSFKRPYAAVLEYFWPLCPDAVHALRKHDGMRHARSDTDVAHAGSQVNHHPQSLAASLAHVPIEHLQQATQQLLVAAGIEGHIGKTKLFLKASQAATLETQRNVVLSVSVLKIQTAWRGFIARRAYQQLHSAAIAMQAWVRAYQARKEAERRRQVKAATSIQAGVRGWQARRVFNQWRQAAIAVQSLWRGQQAQRMFNELRTVRAVVLLQSCWRARHVYLQHRHIIQLGKATVQLQAMWRGRKARKAYLDLLPKHYATQRIQRAWRQRQSAERLRQAFRQVVFRTIELTKAVKVVQTLWRARAARVALERARRVAHRQKFQAKFQMFEAPPAPVTPSASLSKSRSTAPKALLPYQLKQQQSMSVTRDTEAVQDNLSRAQPQKPRGPPPDASALEAIDHLQEMNQFKLSPVLQMWKNMEMTTPHAPLNRAGQRRTTATSSSSAVTQSAGSSAGAEGRANASSGASSAASPASNQSYGQLLDMPQTTAIMGTGSTSRV